MSNASVRVSKTNRDKCIKSDRFRKPIEINVSNHVVLENHNCNSESKKIVHQRK